MKADFLKGYTVLLNAHYIPGPIAAWFMKRLGARIIKIESHAGDYMRAIPPFFQSSEDESNSMSAYFAALNAGFESIVLDLKDPSGAEIFERLLRNCDVYIDGNRPHFLENVIGKTPHDINPEVVFVPITAYGLNGPYVSKAGHDGNCLSIAGTMSYNQTSMRNTPALIGTQIADITAGLVAALTALAMLLGNKNAKCSRKSKLFDCGMLDTSMLFNLMYISKFSAENVSMVPDREWLSGGRGYYNIYLTKDEKPIFFAAIEKKLFKNFAEHIGRKELLSIREKSESHPELLIDVLEKIFSARTFDEWNKVFKDCDCCLTPINTISEAINDEQVRHRHLIQDVWDSHFGILKQMAYPGLIDGENLEPVGIAPRLGEHTPQILKELSYDEHKIMKFYEEHVIA